MMTMKIKKYQNLSPVRKKKNVWILLFAILFFIGLPFGISAQNKPQPITDNEKKQVIDSLSKLLTDYYIYPESVVKMVKLISSNYTNGVYKSITDPHKFSMQLTDDLISVSNDKHFNVVFDPEWIAESRKTITKNDSLQLLTRELPRFKKENFGFKEVKILEGNIGYLKLIGFCPALYAGETAVAAMNFLSNTDAIIIDLRENGGGSPDMVQLLASYFFNQEPELLVEFYTKKGEKRTYDYTLPYLPGKRMVDKDLYILTSNKTFSAAESFAYIFKNRKKATIVGETTGGGAHPVDQMVINNNFAINLPVARPIDPITKTDWEGTGVKPDVEVSSHDALTIAQMKALEKLSVKNTHDNIYAWTLDGLKAKQKPVNVDASVLKSYAGVYGERKLLFENGTLFYQKNGGAKLKLVQMTADLFMFEELSYLRLKVVIENGKVTGITRLFEDGMTMNDKRTK